MTVSNGATPTSLSAAPLTPGRRKLATWSWALWDWAEQPYPTIIQTFIFATYLASDYFGNPDDISAQLGAFNVIAGIIVALTAPMFGRRSDNNGTRKRWLLINTAILIVITGASYFVMPSPSFLVFGLALYAVGNVVQEISFINYYAMLPQLVEKKNVGKVSGFAWGLGYVGGIVLLLMALVGWVLPPKAEPAAATWFNITTDNAENIRFIFLLAAAWMLLFAIPMALFVPEIKAKNLARKETIVESYRGLVRQVIDLGKRSPDALKFLIASAIYRDGLAGVFIYGAILGKVVFGFETTHVIYFGIAANIVAAIGAALGGWLDDKIGTKNTIVGSLVGLIIAGTFVFVGAISFGDPKENTWIYWIGGLALCLFVGPAQASSRTFVARFTPVGREGEIYGLYQTTGRAASFMSSLFWTLSISIVGMFVGTGATIYGILGIIIVLVFGLVLLLRVHPAPVIADELA